MQPKYNYRRRLPHIQKDHRPVFITFATDHRWQFPTKAGDIVLECCLKENGTKFDLHTVMVMPDHAHLLLSPLKNGDGWNFNLPQIMLSRVVRLGRSTYFSTDMVRSGRKNSLIMS